MQLQLLSLLQLSRTLEQVAERVQDADSDARLRFDGCALNRKRAAQQRFGLAVTIGRVVSEDPGMRFCADWLKTVVKEVPAKWIPTGDLYWRAA